MNIEGTVKSTGEQINEMLGIEGSKEEAEEVEANTEEATNATGETSEGTEEEESLSKEGEELSEAKGDKGEEGKEQEGEEELEGKEEPGDEGLDEVGLRETLKALRGQNKLLAEQINAVLSPEEQTVEEGEKKEEERLPTIEVSPFVKDDDAFDSIMKDKDSLNSALNKVAEHAYNKALEQTLLAVPKVVTASVEKEVSNQIMVMEFFQRNEDLLPQRKFTSFVFRELLSQSPDRASQDVLDKDLAKEVRRRLGIQSQGVGQQKKKKVKPSFAPAGGGGKKPLKAPSGIGSEIENMRNL